MTSTDLMLADGQSGNGRLPGASVNDAEAMDAMVALLIAQPDHDAFEAMLRKLRNKAAAKAPEELAATVRPASADGYRVTLTPYSEIDAKLTEWLWEGRMPLGALSLLVGTEGLGKTAVGLRFAADLTRGLLPGVFYGQPTTVALATPEDDAGATVRKRLEAAGGDLTRVLDMRIRKDARDRGFSLPEDTEAICDALIANDVKFLFADPLASMLDPRVNTWKDTDIRDALEPLVGLLAEHGITLLGSLHTNKANSTDPRQRGMGSAGWRQICRAAFLVGLDPDDAEGTPGGARAIAHTKANLGPYAKTMRFTLDQVPVQVQGTTQDTVRSVLGDECDVTAAAMLSAEQGHEDAGQSKEDKAVKWLHAFLADGPMARNAVEEAAEAAGHAWRTIERAKRDFGVESFRPEGVKGWSWRLPEDALTF